MAQRLIWNFEFFPSKQIPLIAKEVKTHDELKWEKRYFWTEDEIIHLNNIDNELLDLANYQQKHKEDCYYLLPQQNLNIKRRKNELLYKPVIKRDGSIIGFGPKINLESVTTSAENPESKLIEFNEIIREVKSKGIKVFVKKESFTFKFSTKPNIKLELARLEVNNRMYFSACIEGRSRELVKIISDLLLTKQKASEYVGFLKSIIR